MSRSVSPRIAWVDTVKALCMVSVYVMHAEVYYSGEDLRFSPWLSPFYVNGFFFMSGYLLVRPASCGGFPLLGAEEARRRAGHVFFRLVLPTLLFSALIYVPKLLFHGRAVTLPGFLFDILGGTAYWFTSALAVAQLLLLFLWRRCGSRPLAFLSASILLFILGQWLCRLYPVNTPDDMAPQFPWFYRTALSYVAVLSLGVLFRVYEYRLVPPLRRVLPFAFLLYAGAALWSDFPFVLQYLGREGLCSPAGGVLLVCGTAVAVALARVLPATAVATYIGRHALMFYFLSGVCPAAVSAVMKRIAPQSGYALTLVVALASLLLSAAVAFVVSRHLPFLLDLRRWKTR